MTPAKLDRLDRLMAEKCMGWHLDPKAIFWYDEKGAPMRLVSDWHPTRDIAQAFQCLEKAVSTEEQFAHLYMVGSHEWTCRIDTGTENIESDSHSPGLSICLAIERWLEEHK